jgi:hypothetical protein
MRKELDEELWKLERENVEDMAKLQKRLLDSSWTLLRRYGLPDEYRLTQSDLDDFDKARREPDKTKSVRMFRALEDNFKTYPPFWYYYGMSARESGDTDASRRCFGEFVRVWRPTLRRDPYRAEVAKYLANDLAESDAPPKEIFDQLKIMMDNTPRENWQNNLFAGMTYYSAGNPVAGIECAQINVDFDIERDISDVVLRSMNEWKLDAGLFADEIQSARIAIERSGKDRGGAIDESAERGLIAWLRGDDETSAELLSRCIGAAADPEDPAPYRILLNILESSPARTIPGLPEAIFLKKELEGLDASAGSSYARLLPIVERYASNGSERAVVFLGDMYLNGLGVPPDEKKAAKLFSGPAGAGNAIAQNALGYIYSGGEQRDDALAAEWFRKSAEQGFPEAQMRLGDMYSDGRGVGQKNLEDAYMWYYLAALNGETSAKQKLDELDGKGLLKSKSVSGATAKRAIQRAQQLFETQKSVN